MTTRRRYITQREIGLHGRTPRCSGCSGGSPAHTPQCRDRFEKIWAKLDEDQKEQLAQTPAVFPAQDATTSTSEPAAEVGPEPGPPEGLEEQPLAPSEQVQEEAEVEMEEEGVAASELCPPAPGGYIQSCGEQCKKNCSKVPCEPLCTPCGSQLGEALGRPFIRHGMAAVLDDHT